MDLRLESFLVVCKHLSYTKAAEELCLTQPAVTQHIQFLERQYQCKLFTYANKRLSLTKAGELLYKYAQHIKTSERSIAEKISELNQKKKSIRFAATMTIGEFTLAPLMKKLIKTFSEYNITMYVDNTETILKMLGSGEIHFALVEGLFNKADFSSRLYKLADFILTASSKHPLLQQNTVYLNDLINETLIIREKGSGSREVLERGLYEKNFTLESFNNIIEIGNVNVIKQLVKDEIGISFMYKDAALSEIRNGSLVEITIADFVLQREFNFIYRNNDLDKKEIDQFFSFFSANLE